MLIVRAFAGLAFLMAMIGATLFLAAGDVRYWQGWAFIAIFAVSGLDHRLSWTQVSTSIAIAGDLLVALGLLIVFFVFRENTFTSSTIEVAPHQRVISTGPYRIVRHPMYSGATIMLMGVPLGLGSLTALLTVVPLVAVIVARLLDEERFLARNLPGYDEYRIRVRKRLVPLLW